MHEALKVLGSFWHPVRAEDDFLVKLRCHSIWDEAQYQGLLAASHHALQVLSEGELVTIDVRRMLDMDVRIAIGLMTHPGFRNISLPPDLTKEQYDAFLDPRAEALRAVRVAFLALDARRETPEESAGPRRPPE